MLWALSWPSPGRHARTVTGAVLTFTMPCAAVPAVIEVWISAKSLAEIRLLIMKSATLEQVCAPRFRMYLVAFPALMPFRVIWADSRPRLPKVVILIRAPPVVVLIGWLL